MPNVDWQEQGFLTILGIALARRVIISCYLGPGKEIVLKVSKQEIMEITGKLRNHYTPVTCILC